MIKYIFLVGVIAVTADLGPMSACEELPDGLLPPLTRVNRPEGEIYKNFTRFIEETPDLLREMFKISHFKVDTKNNKLLHANGMDPNTFEPKQFRSNYT